MSKTVKYALLGIVVIVAAAAYYLRDHTNIDDGDVITVPVSVRLPIPVVDTAFSPYYLAVDKKIFQKHGLNVQLEPGTPELNPLTMVGSGQNEFGIVGGPELLLTARKNNRPIIGLMQIHKDSDLVVLLTLKNSNIDNLEQLRERKVGFFYGHISTDILRMLFKKERVSVEEVDVGFDYGPLITGEVSAQWAFRTTAGITLPAKGVEVNTISPESYGIKTQGHYIIANEKIVKEHPQIVQAFVDAVIEAIEYELEHPEEAVAAATRRDPNFLQTIGEQQINVYHPSIKRNVRIGWIAEEDIGRTFRQMNSVGLIPDEFDYRSSYTDRFLKKHYEHTK